MRYPLTVFIGARLKHQTASHNTCASTFADTVSIMASGQRRTALEQEYAKGQRPSDQTEKV